MTQRELEVLQLVAVGLSNTDIANRLVLTNATVISYLNRIYQKLGVCSRTAAIRYAIDHYFRSSLSEKALFTKDTIGLNAAHGENATSPHARLTKRELEVLHLIAAGFSNAAIAEHLVLALATVISYLNGIYKKLGVSSRTAAMRYAIDHRLC